MAKEHTEKEKIEITKIFEKINQIKTEQDLSLVLSDVSRLDDTKVNLSVEPYGRLLGHTMKMALGKNQNTLAKALIQQKADVNLESIVDYIKDSRGVPKHLSILEIASHFKNPQMIALLVFNNAEPTINYSNSISIGNNEELQKQTLDALEDLYKTDTSITTLQHKHFTFGLQMMPKLYPNSHQWKDFEDFIEPYILNPFSSHPKKYFEEFDKLIMLEKAGYDDKSKSAWILRGLSKLTYEQLNEIYDGDTLLTKAVKVLSDKHPKHYDIITTLIVSGASLKDTELNPLAIALDNSKTDFAQILIHYGNTLNYGSTLEESEKFKVQLCKALDEGSTKYNIWYDRQILKELYVWVNWESAKIILDHILDRYDHKNLIQIRPKYAKEYEEYYALPAPPTPPEEPGEVETCIRLLDILQEVQEQGGEVEDMSEEEDGEDNVYELPEDLPEMWKKVEKLTANQINASISKEESIFTQACKMLNPSYPESYKMMKILIYNGANMEDFNVISYLNISKGYNHHIANFLFIYGVPLTGNRDTSYVKFLSRQEEILKTHFSEKNKQINREILEFAIEDLEQLTEIREETGCCWDVAKIIVNYLHNYYDNEIIVKLNPTLASKLNKIYAPPEQHSGYNYDIILDTNSKFRKKLDETYFEANKNLDLIECFNNKYSARPPTAKEKELPLLLPFIPVSISFPKENQQNHTNDEELTLEKLSPPTLDYYSENNYSTINKDVLGENNDPEAEPWCFKGERCSLM